MDSAIGIIKSNSVHRGINDGLLVRIHSKGTSFCYKCYDFTNFRTLSDEIYRRFSIRRHPPVSFSYAIPGSSQCFLDNDEDLQMLIQCAGIYKLECVDINVLSTPRGSIPNECSAVSSVDSGEDSGVLMIENEFLGKAYQGAKKKHYLSDEWVNAIHSINQKFPGGKAEFRETLKMYASANGFDYLFRRNDNCIHVIYAKGVTKESLQAKAAIRARKCDSALKEVNGSCDRLARMKNKNAGVDDGATTCNWFIKGIHSDSNGFFYIREMDNVHTCQGMVRKLKHERVDSELVMKCIESEIVHNFNQRTKDIIKTFKGRYGFEISYKVASNAKDKAKISLYGTEDDYFNKLGWYKDAVFSINPGSVYELEVDAETNRFKRVFLAYGGCIEGFRYCLPVLYVDGTFGKSKYKGQILAAIGRNGNLGMFPLAMCYCDSEIEDNWNFFFSQLKKILDSQGRVITFVNDRGGGLLSAFDSVFPGNPHLYCYKHLTFNLNKRFSGNKVVATSVLEAFFKVAYSSSVAEFNYNLKLLRAERDAERIDAFLSEIPLRVESISVFDSRSNN